MADRAKVIEKLEYYSTDSVCTKCVYYNVHCIGKLCADALKLLKEQHSDDVTIQYEPANNHGMIVAIVPRKWIRIQPPRRMSDEQRAQSAARLRQYREKNDQFAASGGSDDKQ